MLTDGSRLLNLGSVSSQDGIVDVLLPTSELAGAYLDRLTRMTRVMP